MIEIDFDHPDLDVWYAVCRRFDTGAEAKAAWAALSDLDPTGSWHVGIYRHQRIGKDSEPVLVSLVGDRLEGFEKAEAALAAQGGVEIELHPETWLQMVKRRVEMILALAEQGAGAGRHRIMHPPGGETLS